jgi:hypothetical protein
VKLCRAKLACPLKGDGGTGEEGARTILDGGTGEDQARAGVMAEWEPVQR